MPDLIALVDEGIERILEAQRFLTATIIAVNGRRWATRPALKPVLR